MPLGEDNSMSLWASPNQQMGDTFGEDSQRKELTQTGLIPTLCQHQVEENPQIEEIKNQSQQSDNQSSLQNLDEDKYILSKKKLCYILIILFSVVLAILITIIVLLTKKHNESHSLTDAGSPKQDTIQINGQNYINTKDGLLLDLLTNETTFTYPLSKAKFKSSIAKVKRLPLSFTIGEHLKYEISCNQETKSDIFAGGSKTATMKFNASFVTIGIAAESYQFAISVVMLDQESAGELPKTDQSKGSANDGESQDDDEEAIVNATAGMFPEIINDIPPENSENQDDENADDESDSLDDGTDDPGRNNEILEFAKFMKLSICNISRDGVVTACEFQANMTYPDMQNAVKFLKLYIPDLKLDKYSMDGKKLRLLQESNDDSSSKRSIDTSGDDNSVGVSASDKESDSNDDRSADFGSDSTHGLDLESGKIDSSEQKQQMSMKSSSSEGGFGSLSQSVSFTMKFIEKDQISTEDLTFGFSIKKTIPFTLINKPEEYFANRDISPAPANGEREEMSDEDKEMFGNSGRLLQSNGGDQFPSINQELGKVNLLFATLSAGFAMQQSESDICTTGLYVAAQPIMSFWIFKAQMKADLRQKMREYRYYKLVFEQMVGLFENLTNKTKNMIDGLVFDNLDGFYSDFKQFLKPLTTVESAFQNYTDQKLNKLMTFEESLYLSKSMESLMDAYSTANMNSYIFHAKKRIKNIWSQHQHAINNALKEDIKDANMTISKVAASQFLTIRDKMLGSFDIFLDQFDSSFNSFKSYILSQQSLFDTRFKEGSVSLQDWSGNYLQTLFTYVQGIFLELLLTLNNQYSGDFQASLRIEVHLYHAQLRQSLKSNFDGIYSMMDVQTEGGEELPACLLYLENLDGIEKTVSFDWQPIELAEQDSQIFQEVIWGVQQDIISIHNLLEDILSCGDEKGFFNTLLKKLTSDFDSIGTSVFASLKNRTSSTVEQTQNKFTAIENDLKAIPENIQSLFSSPINQNALITPISLSQEMKEIKGLMQRLDDVMDDLVSLTSFTQKLNAKLGQMEEEVKNILQAPQRIVDRFEYTVDKIKGIAKQLTLNVKLPINGFSAAKFSTDSIKQLARQQIETQAIQIGKQILQKVGKNFGSSFLDSLMTQLDRKIAQLTPKSGRTYLFNPVTKGQDILLFQGMLPLPIGAAFVQIAKTYQARLQVYYEFIDGNIQVVVDPAAEFSYNLRIGWDLFVVKFASVAGVRLFSLQPKIFMNSSIAMTALELRFSLVYQYITLKWGERCWKIRIFRRKIKVCVRFPYLDWSDWQLITQYQQVLGVAAQKVLINKDITLMALN
ncbi:hypothetical protein FGO68_gene134 [Halteria grandinella]|uniref:Uncharacterized protein n=1 Tax=Halteria grandinella TaxID=5974 RepID=A0A8J8P8T7_HALGN|nr:hypothetical protein FGO68_gene134 [Halteria grandinella]